MPKSKKKKTYDHQSGKWVDPNDMKYRVNQDRSPYKARFELYGGAVRVKFAFNTPSTNKALNQLIDHAYEFWDMAWDISIWDNQNRLGKPLCKIKENGTYPAKEKQARYE